MAKTSARWARGCPVIASWSNGGSSPSGIDSPIANACTGVTGDRRITVLDLNLDAPIIRVEIPNDLQAIKKTNMALAQDWRLKTRDLFEAYFARGYAAIDFVRAGEVWGAARAAHNWYVLQRLASENP